MHKVHSLHIHGHQQSLTRTWYWSVDFHFNSSRRPDDVMTRRWRQRNGAGRRRRRRRGTLLHSHIKTGYTQL